MCQSYVVLIAVSAITITEDVDINDYPDVFLALSTADGLSYRHRDHGSLFSISLERNISFHNLLHDLEHIMNYGVIAEVVMLTNCMQLRPTQTPHYMTSLRRGLQLPDVQATPFDSVCSVAYLTPRNAVGHALRESRTDTGNILWTERNSQIKYTIYRPSGVCQI